jgi:uncharacterized membrane protein HdeD (DUF308 family)
LTEKTQTQPDLHTGGASGDTPIPAPAWVRHNWASITALGAILTAGGALALLMPLAAGIAATLVIGAVFTACGAVQLYQTVHVGKEDERGWHALGGAVYLVGGLLLVLQPLAGVVVLSLLLIAVLAVQGVGRMATAYRMRPSRGWGWVAASGGLSALVASLALTVLPLSSLTVLGFFAAVTIGLEGTALLYYAFAARPRDDRTVTPDADASAGEAWA